jgi:toxin ParE1/3/4
VTKAWFLPEALADLEDAFVWCETEAAGLGGQFLRAVRSALDQILEFLEAFSPVHRDARRHLVERFPYCVCYRHVGEGVVVVALLHAARDPELRQTRLGS